MYALIIYCLTRQFKKSKRGLAVLVLLSVVASLSFLQGWQQHRDTTPETITDAKLGLTSTRLRGVYGLEHYGFTVMIPEEVIAYGPYCDSDGICGTSHGFLGRLRDDDKAEIYLFAEYGPTHDYLSQMETSNRKTLDYVLHSTHPPGTRLSIIRSGDVKLDMLPAKRVVAKYPDPVSWLDMIVDVTFTFRVDPTDEILYQIVLRAPADRYEKDKSALELVIKSFKTVPIPQTAEPDAPRR